MDRMYDIEYPDVSDQQLYSFWEVVIFKGQDIPDTTYQMKDLKTVAKEVFRSQAQQYGPE